MSNKTGYLKQKATGDTIIPKTSSAAVYDAAKEQALSATLVDTPLKDTLGFPSFSTVTAYSEGDIVYYANKIYKCKAGGHAAGAWDDADFEETDIKTEIAIATDADNTPTEDSTKLVKSGGVWSWVTGLIAAVKEWASGIFARIDGWYSTLVAGAAENLVGRGSVPAEYTLRTSGGDQDLGTGTATIDVLKGKTLKWQQNLIVPTSDITETINDVTFTDNRDGSYTVNGTASADAIFYIKATPASSSYYCTLVKGHKYLYKGCPANGSNITYKLFGFRVDDYGSGAIYTETADNSLQTFAIVVRSGVQVTNLVFRPIFIDLTDLFGAGNEPTTVAEFEALYPLDYYAHTATPVLINNAAKGIVTTGFNQWDEVVSNKAIDSTTGEQSGPDTTCISSLNHIPVFPSSVYYIKCKYSGNNGVYIKQFDANLNPLSSGWDFQNVYDNTITTSANARYIKFMTLGTYGATYKNDICINLSWSGYRNGEYEPYEQHILYFNGENGSLATLTGKKIVDGVPTGESVIVWPEGMKGFGGKFDFGKADSDGYIRVGNRVFGVVDMGDLEWVYYAGTGAEMMTASLPNSKCLGDSVISNIVCAKYATIAPSDAYQHTAQGIGLNSSLSLRVYSSDMGTDAAAFKAAMSGVPLYYELATPEEYLLDTPIPANYLVNDFGTEQRIPVDTANSVMASISYTVRYSMNAVDELRRLGTNFIRKSSMDNILTALVTAGIIGSYTLTYNETDDDYDCSVTAPETPGE